MGFEPKKKNSFNPVPDDGEAGVGGEGVPLPLGGPLHVCVGSGKMDHGSCFKPMGLSKSLSGQNVVCRALMANKLVQSWALSAFFNFFMNKNDFLGFKKKKLITYFCTSPI